MEGKVKFVVADAGAFIRDAPLQSIGEKIYSLPEVVNEIKDKATRQRLQVLPYQINFKQPSPDAIRFVTEFAKKTGDYRSLSVVDIRVMALTFQLEKENVGTAHIKSIPERKVQWNTSRKALEKPTDIAGFYLGSQKGKSRTTSECSKTESILNEEHSETISRLEEVHDAEQTSTLLSGESCNIQTNTETQNTSENTETKTPVSEPCNSRTNSEPSTISQNTEINTEIVIEEKSPNTETEEQDLLHKRFGDGDMIPSDILEEGSESEEEEEDDSDEEGWITPSNIKQLTGTMDGSIGKMADVCVGCLTTDFAIQNVLIQMGLNVISVDGMLIKQAKSYVLRCHACLRITTNMLKQFCPSCGNNTLKKVSMTVEDDGTVRYFLSRRRPLNTRGTKYSLPMPKGGKHSQNPWITEDMPMPQQRESKKSKQKMDIMTADYVEGTSPFAVTDITSRAAQLGIRQGRSNAFNKRNPNEVHKHGRRK